MPKLPRPIRVVVMSPMALMGYVSAETTLRDASLMSPTVRAAHEAATTNVRARQTLFVAGRR